MMSDSEKVAELRRKNGRALTSLISQLSVEGDDSDRLCDDEERNELLRDVCTLNSLALHFEETATSNSALVKSAEFRRHLRRAYVAHADGILLMARHFSGSRSEAIAAWTELDPCTLLKSTAPIDMAITVIQEKAECLQQISRMTEKCLSLCRQMSDRLREIVEIKPAGLERLDTLSCLDDEETYDLRANVRGWIDDIARLTQELDDTIRIPRQLSQIIRELLHTQKRFLYALMDVMEGCLQTRMAAILSPDEEPPASLPLGRMLDELDVLTDPESHPFLELADSIPHDQSIEKLKSLIVKQTSEASKPPPKPQKRRPSYADSSDNVESSTPQRHGEYYHNNAQYQPRSATAPRQHQGEPATHQPTINFPAYRAQTPSRQDQFYDTSPFNYSFDPYPHSPQTRRYYRG